MDDIAVFLSCPAEVSDQELADIARTTLNQLEPIAGTAFDQIPRTAESIFDTEGNVRSSAVPKEFADSPFLQQK